MNPAPSGASPEPYGSRARVNQNDSYLGVDLGATNLHFILVNKMGKILREKIIPTPRESEKAVEEIIFQTRCLIQKSTKTVGISVAGLVNQKKGIIHFSPNLGWKNLEVIKKIKKYFPRLKVILENDANTAAWGAYFLIGKKKIKNLICLTLGTGLGGGIIINGQLYRGVSGSAGEIGHIILYPQGLRCNCGNYGCIERYVGVNYLVEMAKKEIIQGRKSIIMKLVKGDLKKITPEIIAQAADKNDRLAKNIWEKMGKNLGITLSGIINLLNPGMVVLTGGISKSAKFFLGELKKTLKKNTFSEPLKRVKIVTVKKNLGAIGAALLPRDNY